MFILFKRKSLLRRFQFFQFFKSTYQKSLKDFVFFFVTHLKIVEMSKIQSKSQIFPYKLIFFFTFDILASVSFTFLRTFFSLILEDLFEYLENILTQFFLCHFLLTK